ncbi:hypothetical protein R5R35_004906 [Gryllus longicercus]|uniref:Threonylcarbamoyl-AMP synthase n=1 Tax=Gryllus longicercus TaxID=2509291 RepID=A0AAN9VKN9_9ORTH
MRMKRLHYSLSETDRDHPDEAWTSVLWDHDGMWHSARDNELVSEACRILTAGYVIAVPTDTVYGLAALVQNTSAINSMYQIKGRDPNKPVAICLSQVEDIEKWAKVDDLPPKLLSALLPGKVTVILERKPLLNAALNPGNPKVGIRVPGSDFIRNIVDQVQQPVALTSANSSSETSSLQAEEFKHLWPHIGAVFCDDSNLKNEELRAGSTIIDLSVKGHYSVIRKGVCLAAVREKLKMFELVEGSAGLF